ncbi:tetratricopeptide repeat protein [Desulfobacterales bacterium HSG16]|nr:tetratricopeptide repeat protein [Desulfobacterales bacterium HSG16]
MFKRVQAFFMILFILFVQISFAGTQESPFSEFVRLLEEGMQAYLSADYPRALVKYEKAYKIAEEMETMMGSKEGTGDILLIIGSIYGYLGQYEKAFSFYEKALAIYQEIGNQMGEGTVLMGIGDNYFYMNQYKKSLEFFERALAIYQKIGNRDSEGKCLGNIGLIYSCWEQHDKALSYQKKALTLLQETGEDRIAESSILGNIGVIYDKQGQYKNALSFYEKALTIKREVGDRNGECKNLANIGSLYAGLGRYDKGLVYSKKALTISRESGNRRLESLTLGNIGVIYLFLRQYEKALAFYEKALVIDREMENLKGEGNELTNIGIVYMEMDKYDKALTFFEKALAIEREIGDRRGEGNDLSNIGVVYHSLKQFEKALAFYEKALAVEREIGDRSDEGKNLANIGAVYMDMGQYEKAVEFLKQGIIINGETGMLLTLWEAQRNLAKVETKLENYDNAVLHYEQALKNIEVMREGLSEKEVKISFMHNKLDVYDELITLLQSLHKKHPDKGYDKKSIEIFERKQGRSFLEEMGKSVAINFAGIPDIVIEKENELIFRYSKLQANRIEEGSKEKDRDMKRIRSLEQQMEAVKVKEQKLQEKIKNEYPDYYALKYPKPATLQELQEKVLQPGEMMLVYSVMEEVTCLWVIGKDKKDFALYPIAISETELAKKIRKFGKGTDDLINAIKRKSSKIQRIANRSLKQMTKTGNNLYNLLIPEKVRPTLAKAKTIYVVPSSDLYSLPFEALVAQIDENDKGRYLIEMNNDLSVAYLSSASLLKIIRDAQGRKKEAAKYPLLAFANPVYGNVGTPPDDTNSLKSIQTRSYLNLMGSGTFPALPDTEEEVREIMKALKAPETPQPLQLLEAASRSNLFDFHKKGTLDDFRYLVFACHGVLPGDTDRITQPALVLSNPDPLSKEEGYLTMGDVFGLKLNADLVTLSACNTGKGENQKGEGVRGLTRAFMFAGTPTVSVTLWSVESKSAKELSVGMYKNIQAGKSAAEALKDIKLKMIRGEMTPLYRHPFFWASVVIFGDGR